MRAARRGLPPGPRRAGREARSFLGYTPAHEGGGGREREGKGGEAGKGP